MKRYDAKANKKLFYEKMQPYFDAELARVIYSSDHVTILAFGEICYVACQHILVNDEPVGVYANEKVIKELVAKNRYIFPLMKKVFSNIEKYQSLFYNFPEHKIGIWKEWITDNKNKGVSDINIELEEKVKPDNSRK